MIPYALVLSIAIWDFAVSDHGLVPGGSPDQWEWGVPAGVPGGSDPVWGTQLDGAYLNEAEDTLQLPMPDLGTAAKPVLVLEHWHEIGKGDAGAVEVDVGGGWVVIEPNFEYPTDVGFAGLSGGWIESSFELSGLGSRPAVRLVFSSDELGSGLGWYVASIGLYDGDVTPPRLQPVKIPVDTQDLVGPYPVRVSVIDDTAVEDVWVYASFGGGIPVRVTADKLGGGVWEAALPGQEPDTWVRWYAVASDGEQLGRWPVSGEEAFRVFLAAPVDLRGPEGRVVGQEVELDWVEPDSPHPVLGYRAWEEGSPDLVQEVVGLGASVPVEPGGTGRFRVSAVYDAGEGDATEPLQVDLEVPTLEVLEPGWAYQGDRIHLDLTGTSLYLLEGLTDMELGQGVEVESIDVLDVGTATAVIAVDDDAVPGSRDLWLEGGQGDFTFVDAFRVRDGDIRPRILLVQPDSIVQGRTATLVVKASTPFAAVPEVDPGEGLVVTSEVEVVDDLATFDLLASGTAPPGERILVLDDGQRLWAADFEVRDYVVPPGRQCGSTPLTGWWGLLPVVVARRSRRARPPGRLGPRRGGPAPTRHPASDE